MLGQRLTYGTIYGAVEHASDIQGEDFFHVLLLKKRKQELIIKERISSQNFNEVTNVLAHQKHIFLVVNNQHVLTKEVTSADKEPRAIFQSAFPNINTDDFYYEIIHSNDKTFIAISRKTYINELLASYRKQKISVIGVSLGNLAIENLLPFLETKELNTSNAKISIQDCQIDILQKEYVSKVEDYRINDLEVSNNDMLSLSGILSYYLKGSQSKGLEDLNTLLQDDFKQSQVFKFSLYAALGFLFISLLTNLLVFTDYHSKINKLNTEVQLLETHKSQLLKLQSLTAQKEQLVGSLQATTNSKVSLYLDKIAEKVPNTLLLSQLTYQPLSKRVKTDKPLQYNRRQIIIKGETKNHQDFTGFITDLEKKRWIDNITILNYGSEKSKTTLFEVLLNLNDE